MTFGVPTLRSFLAVGMTGVKSHKLVSADALGFFKPGDELPKLIGIGHYQRR